MEILFWKEGKKSQKIEFALNDKRLFLRRSFIHEITKFLQTFLYEIKVMDAYIYHVLPMFQNKSKIGF